jgi:hypothetical protein
LSQQSYEDQQSRTHCPRVRSSSMIDPRRLWDRLGIWALHVLRYSLNMESRIRMGVEQCQVTAVDDRCLEGYQVRVYLMLSMEISRQKSFVVT